MCPAASSLARRRHGVAQHAGLQCLKTILDAAPRPHFDNACKPTNVTDTRRLPHGRGLGIDYGVAEMDNSRRDNGRTKSDTYQ